MGVALKVLQKKYGEPTIVVHDTACNSNIPVTSSNVLDHVS